MKALLKIQDVMQITGVSRSQIYSLIAVGLFPKPLKIRRLARWTEDDIQDWILKQRRRVK